MALVLMAQLFLLDANNISLLSCADLVELFSAVLPVKGRTAQDVIAAMEERYRKRQGAIDSAYKCQAVH